MIWQVSGKIFDAQGCFAVRAKRERSAHERSPAEDRLVFAAGNLYLLAAGMYEESAIFDFRHTYLPPVNFTERDMEVNG